MSGPEQRPATWGELSTEQQEQILGHYRALPAWAALGDETLEETVEMLYDSVEHNKRMRAFIAATMTPAQREALPGSLEDMAQDSQAHGMPDMDRAVRQDLMRWVGESQNEDPRQAVSGWQEDETHG